MGLDFVEWRLIGTTILSLIFFISHFCVFNGETMERLRELKKEKEMRLMFCLGVE